VIFDALTNVRRRPQRVVARARYAELAPHYDASCARIARARDYALAMLNPQRGETIIDVACGTGASLPGLAERVGKAGRVIGIEQSPHMVSRARKRFSGRELPANVQIVEAPVEEARTRLRADALLLCYTHDVLQLEHAVQNLVRLAKPGARVVVVGLRLLPWWYATPVNVWNCWTVRKYLTTYRGLRQPWQPLRRYCSDFAIIRTFHAGSSYAALGHLDVRKMKEPAVVDGGHKAIGMVN